LAGCDITQITALRKHWPAHKKTLSISCHHGDELEQAHRLGADYAMLSPVFPTLSHPGAAPLGIATFESLCAATALPVVALGGISTQNCNALQSHPLAVIGAILDADDPFSAAQHLRRAASKNNAKESAL
ncbi:MAG: thiamine phosphate synthase, partial [Mariprofundaceae bacterium]|nr:thiamine phosphate synthase [Mariprofundaceae bacterium]